MHRQHYCSLHHYHRLDWNQQQQIRCCSQIPYLVAAVVVVAAAVVVVVGIAIAVVVVETPAVAIVVVLGWWTYR